MEENNKTNRVRLQKLTIINIIVACLVIVSGVVIYILKYKPATPRASVSTPSAVVSTSPTFSQGSAASPSGGDTETGVLFSQPATWGNIKTDLKLKTVEALRDITFSNKPEASILIASPN